MNFARERLRSHIMYTAVSGKIAVVKQMELIANNLANVGTTGFKAERPLFEKAYNDQKVLLSSSLKKDVDAPLALKTDDFTSLKGSFADFSSGPLEVTNNPLDVAVDGKGFFVVQTSAGERYTRAGNFRLDETGRIVTQNGNPVMGQGGEITVPPGDLSFGNDGSIKVNGKAVGKLRIVDINAADAVHEAGQLFSLKGGASAAEVNEAKVSPGSLEGSNVNAVRELASMILASRLYESFKNTEDAHSKMNEQRNQKLGSIQG